MLLGSCALSLVLVYIRTTAAGGSGSGSGSGGTSAPRDGDDKVHSPVKASRRRGSSFTRLVLLLGLLNGLLGVVLQSATVQQLLVDALRRHLGLLV